MNLAMMIFVGCFIIKLETRAQSINEGNQNDCHLTIDSENGKIGEIRSPGFPKSYKTDSNCIYKFQAKTGQRVQIIFKDLNLYLPPGVEAQIVPGQKRNKSLEYDHLTAHVLIEGKLTEIETFCGSEMPPRLMSADTFLQMDFDSQSNQSTAQSFNYRFEYRFVTNFGIEIGTKSDKHDCNFQFNSSVLNAGYINSPNYPGYYPRHTDCQYEFFGEESEKVEMHFAYFDVAGSQNCGEQTSSDYVVFGSYQTENRNNQRYCGSKTPLGIPILSESNYFRIMFHTNDAVDGKGFIATYKFVGLASASNIELSNPTAQLSTVTEPAQQMTTASPEQRATVESAVEADSEYAAESDTVSDTTTTSMSANRAETTPTVATIQYEFTTPGLVSTDKSEPDEDEVVESAGPAPSSARRGYTDQILIYCQTVLFFLYLYLL